MSSHGRRALTHGSLVTRSQVINTTGLHIDYTSVVGLQAHEIQLDSPDRFPCERCDLDSRLDLVSRSADGRKLLGRGRYIQWTRRPGDPAPADFLFFIFFGRGSTTYSRFNGSKVDAYKPSGHSITHTLQRAKKRQK